MTDHPDIVERLSTSYPDTPYHRDSLHTEAAAEITRLRAEAEALRKDAERWRALFTICDRDDDGSPYLAIERPRDRMEDEDDDFPRTWTHWIYKKEEGDSTIDAAIAATKEQQHEH